MSNIGMRVEDLFCNGFGAGETLSDVERVEIVEWTLRFEECSYSREDLGAMSDKDLIGAAYWAMSEYASGQI